MKLLFCRRCCDVRRVLEGKTVCSCGESSTSTKGQKVSLHGDGMILFGANTEFYRAKAEFDKSGVSRTVIKLCIPALKSLGVVRK
jgi:hypothetical protein